MDDIAEIATVGIFARRPGDILFATGEKKRVPEGTRSMFGKSAGMDLEVVTHTDRHG